MGKWATRETGWLFCVYDLAKLRMVQDKAAPTILEPANKRPKHHAEAASPYDTMNVHPDHIKQSTAEKMIAVAMANT
jgi:hypothetical protein